MTTTNAIQMQGYGGPDVLAFRPMDLPPLRPDELRIRTIAAAVNHTDLEIRAGHWPIRSAQPFPYVPGVEVMGEVVAVGSDARGIAPGDRVITMMQGLGGVRAERPGGYAEMVTVAADAVAIVAPGVDLLALAALGLAGVTAHEGLVRIGPLDGKTILITGAAGGVGSAAVAVAKAQGARVLGVVSRAEQVDYLLGLGADQVIATADGISVPENSVDGVLDTVGGDLFAASVSALRPVGVLSLVGAVGGGNVGFDLWSLIRPVTLTGYSSESLDGPSLRKAVAVLAKGLTSGRMKPPRFTSFPLADAARAHAMLEARGVTGRVLLIA